MIEKKYKTRDMVIAIFCTVLAILCIVFYFLPAFNVKHRIDQMHDWEVLNYSAFDITRAAFSPVKIIDVSWSGLMYIKDVYGIGIIMAGILSPLVIICSIVTAVFSYLNWLKNESFKKYCFVASLCGMVFQTIVLIIVWYIALQIKSGQNFEYFNMNLKGGISYASFVSLIIAFVIAIIACAHNYFLDNFDDVDEDDDEDDEDDEDEEDEDEEEEVVVVRKKVAKESVEKEPKKEKTTTKKSTAKSKATAE